MYKVIIDTNFLLIPEQFKVDIFTEFKNLLGDVKLYIIDKTVDEFVLKYDVDACTWNLGLKWLRDVVI